MSRVLRRAKARREPLSESMRHYLHTGDYGERDQFGSWFDTFMLAGQFMRSAARDGIVPAVWTEWREDIIGEHIAEAPGSRPFAWWICAAPAPREVGGLPAELHTPPWHWRLHRGLPFQAYTVPRGTVLRLESEAHFLRRLGLLEPAERRRLTVKAYEPDVITIGEGASS
jgi:hypothetical protein